MEKRSWCDIANSGLNQFQNMHLPRVIRNYSKTHPEIDSEGIAFIQGKDFPAWASGVRARFCHFICLSKDSCDVIYDRPYPNQETMKLPKIQAKLSEMGLSFICDKLLPELQAEIGRNQYYLARKREFPVEEEEAERDYVENYLTPFIEGFCLNESLDDVRRELEESQLAKIYAQAT